MKIMERERRDLGLFALILPIGILLMLGAGQVAIRLLPNWNVNASMGSQMDPNQQYAALREGKVIEPVLAAILTPPAWSETFLTPQAGQGNKNAVPLVVFVPSATPSPAATETAVATTEVPPTNVTTATTVPTIVTTTAPTTTTIAPTTVWNPPDATKTKKTEPDDPPPDDPGPPTPAPVPSTPVGTQVAAPAGINVNAPPDGIFATFADGKYAVVDLGLDKIKWVHVTTPSDTAADLVYYERVGGTDPVLGSYISMDSVIVGISHNSDGNPNYTVFNWGDGVRDKNTNVDTTTLGVPAVESDNQTILTSELYKDPAAPPASPQTGITIDVDNAPSNPPAGDYEYVVIQAPESPPGDGNDGAEVDAVQALP